MKHLYTLVFFTAITFNVNAQWNTDTLVRNAICTAASTQYNAEICTDGSKGAIMAWNDLRVNPSAIYVQRIDSNGVTKWGNNGVKVNVNAGGIGATDTKIIEDGSGGAFVVYDKIIIGGQEQIYAQHYNKSGQELWAPGGIVVNNTGDARLGGPANDQSLAPDGTGGVFITWYQYVSGSSDIMVQHLDANGNNLWQLQGLKISVVATFHYVSRIVSTGNNTAVLAYLDGSKLQVQSLAANGAKLFGNNGIQVSNTADYSDNFGFNIRYFSNFIFFAWTDTRAQLTSRGLDLYAQKMDLNGVMKWQANGVVVDTSNYNSLYPEMISDKAGGFYISYGYAKGFVQHVSKNGVRQWGGITGLPIASSSNQFYQHICDDGGTGLIVTWDEQRYSSKMDIFSQHFNSDGVSTWRPNGLPVIITPGNVGIATSSKLLSLKNGRAIACWTDYRTDVNGADIYAARFDSSLPVKGPLAMLTDKKDVTCYGGSDGSATALPYGGTMPYTYLWDNNAVTQSITSLAAGTYSVTVTDNLGAQVNASITIKQPVAPTITITTGGNTITCGTPVTLNCNTTGAVSYQWQKSSVDIPGANNSTYIAAVSGNYRCIVNYACSQKTSPVTSVSITNLNAAITPAGTQNVCSNTANILLSATPKTAAYTFQWYENDVAIPGATSHTFTALDINSVYYVIITHTASGCFDTSNATGIFKTCLTDGDHGVDYATKTGQKSIRVYPNPARSMVNIDLSSLANGEDIILTLTDASGRQVMHEKISSSKALNHAIDVSKQAPGMYILTVRSGNEKFVQKLIVVK